MRLSVSFFFSSRRRHTRFSRDVCSSDLFTRQSTAFGYFCSYVATNRLNAFSAFLRLSACQISCSADFASGCCAFGSLSRMFTVLWTQQRCARVVGTTSAKAAQKSIAPSPTPSFGGVLSPRSRKLCSYAFQLCLDSRKPSSIARKCFFPRASQPI